MSTNTTITIYRGTTYDFTYNHVDGDGDPLPLTGCTVYFTVKRAEYDDDADDSDALIQKTITDHDDAAGGVTSWQLTDEDTQQDVDTHYYDVVVEDADGHALPPTLLGQFIIRGKRTNRNVEVS